MKVIFRQETEGEKGKTILEVAKENQIKIKAPCEKGKCGKCKVRVLAGELKALTKEEKKELSKKEIADGIRLACMAEVIDEVTVEIVKKKKK